MAHLVPCWSRGLLESLRPADGLGLTFEHVGGVSELAGCFEESIAQPAETGAISGAWAEASVWDDAGAADGLAAGAGPGLHGVTVLPHCVAMAIDDGAPLSIATGPPPCKGGPWQ